MVKWYGGNIVFTINCNVDVWYNGKVVIWYNGNIDLNYESD